MINILFMLFFIPFLIIISIFLAYIIFLYVPYRKNKKYFENTSKKYCVNCRYSTKYQECSKHKKIICTKHESDGYQIPYTECMEQFGNCKDFNSKFNCKDFEYKTINQLFCVADEISRKHWKEYDT